MVKKILPFLQENITIFTFKIVLNLDLCEFTTRYVTSSIIWWAGDPNVFLDT